MEAEVLIVRLRKESLRKCSLAPLIQRQPPRWQWHHCDLGDPIAAGEVTLLHPDGEPLSPQDSGRPLLLVDSSWRDLPRMLRTISGTFHRRSLPGGLRTAYPRKSNWFPDPETGLASVEALHAALALLGRRDDRLLEGYHFAQEYLALNADLLSEA